MTVEPPPPTPSERAVVALVGVYDADGTPMGELAYFVGARLGRTHCSLCEITHGLVRAKPAWTRCRAELAVPFATYHRNDVPDAVRAAAEDRWPAVVAEVEGGAHVLLLGPEPLDACHGSLDAMLEQLTRAATTRGLVVALGDVDPSV